MSDWKFRRRQGLCSGCQVKFVDGTRHVSALRIVGEDLSREDHCLHCFGRLQDTSGVGAVDLFFWYTRHHEGKRALQLDLATLEQLFLTLEGRAEPRVRELRYVLCLLLLRKRRLKLDRILREAGGEAMVLHRPRRKETLKVFVFEFSPERLAALKGDLLALLEGAEPPAGEGAAAAGAEGDEGGPAELAAVAVAGPSEGE